MFSDEENAGCLMPTKYNPGFTPVNATCPLESEMRIETNRPPSSPFGSVLSSIFSPATASPSLRTCTEKPALTSLGMGEYEQAFAESPAKNKTKVQRHPMTILVGAGLLTLSTPPSSL